MARYIDADALADNLSMAFSDMNTNQYDNQDDALEDAAVTVLEAIHNAPAADVAPVRHGGWQVSDNEIAGTLVRCSVCCMEHTDVMLEELEEFAMFFHYCPYCGARMDGGMNNDKA